MAWIRYLAQELPYATGAGEKKKKIHETQNTPNEISQTQKTYIAQFLFCEISRLGKSIETEGR